MKIGKKVIVSTLSTTMAVAFVAALSGTVAWYQFNTRVSTTLIGTNVADTGVLQISKDEIDWKRDLITSDLVGNEINITPVTFGQMNVDGSLPAQAYMKPEDSSNGQIGVTPGSYADVYQQATANVDYIQYTVYIRAQEVNNVANGIEQVEKAVYLSDITMQDVNGAVTEGLRVHLAIDADRDGNDEKNLLISKSEVKDLDLSGVLDLNANGAADLVGGPEWNANRNNMVIYGVDGEKQSTIAANDVKINRNEISTLNAQSIQKKLFTTPATGSAKVTVTIWMEGWDRQVGHQDNVELSELAYRKEVIKPVSNVGGLFVLTANNYVKQAAGNAVDGVTYVDLFASELDDLEPYSVMPANTFELVGDNYNLTADGVVNPAKHYYSLIELPQEIVYPADVSDQLSNLLELDAGNYVPTADTVAEWLLAPTKEYFSLVNEDVDYDPVVLEDGLHNPLPEGAVDVSNYFVDDGHGNMIHASGMNVDGVTYYEIANFGHADNVPMWSGENTDGAVFNFGLTFDVGPDGFKA